MSCKDIGIRKFNIMTKNSIPFFFQEKSKLIDWGKLETELFKSLISKSVHPPHFTKNKLGHFAEINPAFIPICISGFESVGLKHKGFKHKLCEDFDPFVFNGKQCYRLDTSKEKFKSSYLTLLVDSRTFDLTTYSTKIKPEYFRGKVAYLHPDLSSGRIYLDTTESLEIDEGLTLFENLQDGSERPFSTLYLKVKRPIRYTYTENFESLSSKQRNCLLQTEAKRNYRRKSCIYDYILTAKELQCNCSRWFRADKNTRVCSVKDLPCLGDMPDSFLDLVQQEIDLYSQALVSCQESCEKFYVTIENDQQHPDKFPFTKQELFDIARDYTEFKLR